MISISLRDRLARLLTAQMEPKRQALRYIIHNRENSLNVRIKAQLALQKLPRYSRPSSIKPRCIVGFRARHIIMPFKLNPVQFRKDALDGNLPGVKKSFW